VLTNKSAVRITYAVVVLIKLYLSATTPGEISNVINEEDLHIEQSLTKLERSFTSITERDRLAPHTKFLFVIQQLVERYRGIKRRQDKLKSDEADKDDTRKTSSRPNSAAGGRDTPAPMGHRDPNAMGRNRGLHLLSEVAMSTSPSPSPSAHQGSSSAPAVTPVISASHLSRHHSQQPTVSHGHKSRHSQHISPHSQPQIQHASPQHMSQPHPQGQQPQTQQQPQQQQQSQQQAQQQQWYPQHQPDLMPLGEIYDYPGHFSALEGFDYGLSGLGMGMDGAVTGLFMGDVTWMGAPNGWPGAGWGG
jgi:hypothetical protein